MMTVFGGDFRQVLQVIPKGSRQDIISASLKQSYLWDHCKALNLTKNMRLTVGAWPEDVTEIREFAEWILKVGDGELGEENDSELNILDNINDPSYFKEKVVLAPTNEVVDNINEHLLNKFPGEEMVYLSCNSVDKTERNAAIDQSIFSSGFINGLKFFGVPNHMLALKVGVPVMLLRNIDQPNGLCNGTRLQVLKLTRTSISAQIINGTHFGNKVIIPRLRITPSDKRLSLKIVRKQFPLSVSFAMTINKSQVGEIDPYLGGAARRHACSHGGPHTLFSSALFVVQIVIEKGFSKQSHLRIPCPNNLLYKVAATNDFAVSLSRWIYPSNIVLSQVEAMHKEIGSLRDNLAENAKLHEIASTSFSMGESFYNPYIPQTLDLLRQSNLIEDNEGAQVIFTERKPNPLIVVKSNRGFDYDSTDIAALWPEMPTALLVENDKFLRSAKRTRRTTYTRVNERQMQTTEEKVDISKALDASLVNTNSNGTEFGKQDTSSSAENVVDDDDADIKPVYDEEPMAEVQLTAKNNVFSTEQRHTEQPEFNNEGEVDQNADQCHDIRPLPAKSADDQITELSNQSLESKNICVIETTNIELEHKVVKLLKKNETLKKHYKELYDSIKTTRAKIIEHTTYLIAQNAEFKAQLQEKGFAIAALKMS
ncbi:ATP-dependent DNA helicase PIF1-like protein [Tanacetum coccineum]